jgi:hypothetical protein
MFVSLAVDAPALPGDNALAVGAGLAVDAIGRRCPYRLVTHSLAMGWKI